MKALLVLMLAILAMNVSYAGYGEDAKGECKNGTDSSRGQEVIVSEQPSSEGSQSVEAGSESTKK